MAESGWKAKGGATAGCEDATLQGVVLGLVEVTRSMGDLGQQERIRVAHMCYSAVCGREVTRVDPDPEYLGVVQSGCMGVQVVLDNQSIQLHNLDYMVARHRITGLSAIVAIHKKEGHLVYVGHCFNKPQRLGVVLNLWTADKVTRLVHELLQIRNGHPAGPEPAASSTSEQKKKSHEEALPAPPLPPRHKYPSPPPVPPTTVELRVSNSEAAVRHALPLSPPHPLPRTSLPDPTAAIPQDRPCSLPAGGLTESPICPGPTPPTPLPRMFTNDTTEYPRTLNTLTAQDLRSITSQNFDRPLPTPPSNATAATSPPNPNIPSSSFNTTLEANSTPSSSRGSSGDSDNEKGDYENDHYFMSLGMNVKESEHIYLMSRIESLERENQVDVNASKSLKENISNFLSNEHSYLASIQRITKARRQMGHDLQPLLQGIDKLADIHRDMYVHLYAGYPSPGAIAKVFLDNRMQFKPYVYYLMNAPMTNQNLKNLPEELLREFPSLKDDIRLTWKRLHFYFMSLESMLADAPNEDRPMLQEAVDMFREMNRKGDSAILIDAVKDIPFNLFSRGELLLHSQFTIKSFTMLPRGKVVFRVLLFADIIVVTLPKNQQYFYQEHLSISQLQYVSQNPKCPTELVLEVMQGGTKKNRKYTFISKSQSTIKAWAEEIMKLLKKNVEEIKQMNEMRYGTTGASRE